MLLAAAVLMICAAGCKKERNCECTSETELPNMYGKYIINIDRSMRCDHITNVGLEALVDGQTQTQTTSVSCIELEEEK